MGYVPPPPRPLTGAEIMEQVDRLRICAEIDEEIGIVDPEVRTPATCFWMNPGVFEVLRSGSECECEVVGPYYKSGSRGICARCHGDLGFGRV